MPAFMSRRFTGTLRGADAGCLYGLHAQQRPMPGIRARVAHRWNAPRLELKDFCKRS